MQIARIVVVLSLCLGVEVWASEKLSRLPQQLLALKVVGDRSNWKLMIELTNESGKEIELAELKLPWGYPSSFTVRMRQDPQCPAMKEVTAMENRPQVIRYVVLPHGQTVDGKVDLLDRWPALKSRQTICKDHFTWEYSVNPRNSKRIIQLSGDVVWKD